MFNNKIYKSFKNERDMINEWNFIKKCDEIYSTRYTNEAELLFEFKCIVFPLLSTVTIITNKLISDVKKQIIILNNNGIIHLDVSKDNIVYDSYRDLYHLIDYGNAMMLENVDNLKISPYKKIYRNPKGFDKNSDLYALSVLEKMMVR